jgi:predicted PurR-regulated permease PerM
MDRTHGVVLALAGTLLLLTALLVMPFLQFFLLAVLLAYPLQPLHRRLTERTSPQRSAGALVAGVTVVIVLPALMVLWTIAGQASALLDRIRSIRESGETGNGPLTGVEDWIETTTEFDVDLVGQVQAALAEADLGTFENVIGVFGTITHLLVGLGLTVFLLYYFVKNGSDFSRWLHATAPLPDNVQDQLHAEFNDVMRAVLVSHVFIAVIQGVVAGLGLIVVGVPSAVFWTVVMIILAVLPIIGSFLVWGPAVLYLVSINRPVAAGFLLVYGTIVVGLTDDYLRPIVIERYTQTTLNPGVILIGVLGGVYLIGFMGIFFGPIIVGSLRAVLDVYRREYVDGAIGAS